MKKLLLLLLFVFGTVNAQIVNIPDINFKSKLLQSSPSNQIAINFIGVNIKIDSNNDGEIQQSEALQVSQLNVYISNITDLSGIQGFTNLRDLKCFGNNIPNLNLNNMQFLKSVDCSNCHISTLSLSGDSSLTWLGCASNQLASLDLSSCLNLNNLSCNYNNLTALSVDNLTNLGYLSCSNNNLTQLNLLNNVNLKLLQCSNNSLSSLQINHLVYLEYLSYGYNNLTFINIDNFPNLWGLECSGLNLTTLNLTSYPKITNLNCSYNSLTNLDLSSQINLQSLSCQVNHLETLNIKNGFIEQHIYVYGNPNLIYVCADENQVSDIQNLVGAVVSSYCSFTPGGSFNKVSGTVRFDMNNNGCSSTDPALPNSVHLNITDGAVSSGTFPTTDGTYLLYTLTGTNVLTTSLENPTYFTISPSTATITTTTLGNTQTQDFCITANGVHKDAEIVIVPIQFARPGFEATYKIVYKNKGNQILSGDLNFTYDDSVLDYVSSTVNPNIHTTGNLGWNYTNLLPFESRSFIITLHVNATTVTPPVNIGDLLNFTATINPISGDETPLDNVFAYNQIVIGAFDPNNKICLEGEVVASAKIGDYLHYNINFENTGTAAAENIVVKDVIDTTKYDINSLQIINSSHSVKTKITGNNVEFIFQNINLGASQYGNVVFKIKTLSNLTIGTTATNTANIYFDYNFPIQTNTASTTFQNLNSGQFVIDNSIAVSPNPTSSFVNINVDNNNTIKSVQVFDIQGRLLETQLINDVKTAINLSEKMTGIYFLKITSDKGSKIEKIVKE